MPRMVTARSNIVPNYWQCRIHYRDLYFIISRASNMISSIMEYTEINESSTSLLDLA